MPSLCKMDWMLFLKCPSFRLYYCLHAFVWTGMLFSFSRTKTVSKHVAEIYWSLCKCSPEVWKTEVPLQAPCQWAFIFSKDSSYKKSLRNTVSISALSDSMLGSGPDLSYFTNPQNFVGVKAVVFPTNGGEISLEYYQAWNHQYFNAKQGGVFPCFVLQKSLQQRLGHQHSKGAGLSLLILTSGPMLRNLVLFINDALSCRWPEAQY